MTSAPRAIPPSVNGWSPEYLESRYALYKSDPGALDEVERMFFAGFDLAMAEGLRFAGAGSGASSGTSNGSSGGVSTNGLAMARAAGTATDSAGRLAGISEPVHHTPFKGRPAGRAGLAQAIVDDFITAYRQFGHLAARIDPFDRERERPEELTLAYHGLSESDLEQSFNASDLGESGERTLRWLIDRLEGTYCGHIGVELMHINDHEVRGWLVERVERSGGRIELSKADKAEPARAAHAGGDVRAVPGQAVPGREAVQPRGLRVADPAAGQAARDGERSWRRGDRAGHGPPRPAQRAQQHPGQDLRADLHGVRGELARGLRRQRRGREVPPGLLGHAPVPNGRMLHLAMASNPSHLEAVGGGRAGALPGEAAPARRHSNGRG
jgi:2-oxoglutarate dehydrogenase E1 component